MVASVTQLWITIPTAPELFIFVRGMHLEGVTVNNSFLHKFAFGVSSSIDENHTVECSHFSEIVCLPQRHSALKLSLVASAKAYISPTSPLGAEIGPLPSQFASIQ